MTNQEKLTEGLEALKEFFDSLGPNDIYKEILLETLFDMLSGKENNDLSVPGKARQVLAGGNNDHEGRLPPNETNQHQDT